MRLLFLAPFPPRQDGWHGGARVIAQIVHGLARLHETALLYSRGRDEPLVDEALTARCALTEAIERPAVDGPLARRARQLGWILTGRPVWVAEWATPAFAHRLRELAEEWRPDLVQIEYQVMAQYLDALDRCPATRVLDVHEAGTLAAEDERRFRRAAALALALDARAWRRYEREILRRVNAATVVSERDRHALDTLAGPTRLIRVPIGVPAPPQPLDPVGSDPPGVLFVGSFRHRPNIDAALRLVRHIHPLVRARRPDVMLTIVGEQPPQRLRKHASGDVSVTGPVPDVAPYLERAAVVVAPIRFGGGVRVKVLEALAAGKAVVASPLAAAEIFGDHLVVAESDEEFAVRICELLDDPASRARLGTAGRAWALAHASPERMIAAYESLYESVLAGQR